jgi:tetratricopeptide (TPR) repeat protein
VYQKEKERFTEREIFAQTRDLQARLNTDNRNVKALNKIGAVYARYGRMEEAQDYFSRVLQIKEYYPALINMGGILYLEENFKDALPYYLRAEKLKPSSSVLLLQLSRIHNKLGNLNESAAYFDKLEAANPKLADRFSYLDVSKSSTARASGQEAGKEVMLWQEEE